MHQVEHIEEELRMYTLADAAKILGVCPKTVLREADRNKIKIVKIGKLNMVRLHDLKVYVESLEAV